MEYKELSIIDKKQRNEKKRFVRSYKIKNIIPENSVRLKLLVLIKIHLVINMSKIVLYQE